MDKREKRSREAVYQSFMKLLEEKEYDQISVNDILRESGLSRSTFYSHFQNKDDVLRDVCDSIYGEVFNFDFDKLSGGSVFDYRRLIYELFYKFYGKRDLAKAIFSSNRSAIFSSQIRKRSWPLMYGAIKSRLFYREGVPERLQAHQLTHSYISLLEHWVSHDDAYSPEQMYQIFLKLYE